MSQEEERRLKPTYYHDNFNEVLSFVSEKYAHFLTDSERSFIETYCDELSKDAQCLLVRLLARVGPYFVVQDLSYDEIQNETDASLELVSSGFAVEKIEDVESFVHQMNKSDIVEFLEDNKDDFMILDVDPSWKKPLFERQVMSLDSFKVLRALNAKYQVISLECREEYELLKLLYFGNLHQDLHEFILEELNILKYEKYPLDDDLLYFSDRVVVDQHRSLSAVADLIWNYKETKQFEFARMAHNVLVGSYEWHDRVLGRLSKLRGELGYEMERLGEHQTALHLYDLSGNEYSRERIIRIYDKEEEYDKALELLEEFRGEAETYDGKLFCERFGEQLKRKLGLPYIKAKRFKFPETKIEIDETDERVEDEVLNYYIGLGYTGFYSENTMLSAITGLLFWDIIFSSQPGVFFHPFQRGPVDLFSSGFASIRKNLITERLTEFKDHDQLKTYLIDRFQEKQGLANWLVHWKAVTLDQLDQVLSALSQDQILGIAEHMILNLRAHRSGMPDLILFSPEGEIILTEVKGPGDQLRNNQRAWLGFFDEIGVKAQVVRVVYSESL